MKRPVISGWTPRGSEGCGLPIDPLVRYHHGRIRIAPGATLILQLRSPRPIRLWLDGTLLLDESLSWRDFQREVRAAAVWPSDSGDVDVRVEFGDRPTHPAFVDQSCPSRNRAAVMAAVAELHPDALAIDLSVAPASLVAAGLRFVPTQFWRDGVLRQHVLVRSAAQFDAPPSSQSSLPADAPLPWLALRTAILPFDALDATATAERERGVRRFLVPVADAATLPAPLRRAGDPDDRPEPSRAVATVIDLLIEGLETAIAMPVYEPVGRLAPRHEHVAAIWPEAATLARAVPEPVLPSSLAGLRPVWDEAWAMLLRLARCADPASGLTSDYLSTGSNFGNFQFVWDSCFTALSAAYGHRALPATATLDLLYSRQFDGGYIHRQHDVRDGSAVLFEPDFSPNPPLLSVIEWRIASLTGDRLRLARVYPALVDHHRWLDANRRLPDGCYWTTGLASGLDNAPSLGAAYSDLTSQMAHDAAALGDIAEAIGRSEDAAAWRAACDLIAAALNARCWNPADRIYATGLDGGGHNPNKIVTAFWPLWAGIAPVDRAAAMARHAEDPASFARHHPLASLGADSPSFDTGGRYWLGSVWPPTNYVAISGLARTGYREVARRLALRHLSVVAEVFRETGRLWENYSPDASAPGSWSGADYGWSALGPIALLLEIVLGIEPDALARRITWTPPPGETCGVRRYPLGSMSIDLACRAQGEHLLVEVATDALFTLVAHGPANSVERRCAPGTTRFIL